MNVMEEIFEIRSCIEILANDIKVDSIQLMSICSGSVQRAFFVSCSAPYIA